MTFNQFDIRDARETIIRETQMDMWDPARACPVCRTNIAHRRRDAKTCGQTCRKRLSNAHIISRLTADWIKDEERAIRRRKAHLTELKTWLDKNPLTNGD